MPSETNRGSWSSRVEEVLRELRDVDGVRVIGDGEVIREIHVMTSSDRPAKQIVRDVETAIQTRLGRAIDHRIVSVAHSRPTNGHPPAPAGAETGPLPVSAPVRERIRFVSVNLFVSGPRTQAQVELRWRGTTRMGSASGWTTREGGYRLVASAAVQAIQQFLDEEIGIGVHDVSFIRLGKNRAAVVSLALVTQRREKLLAGTCPVDADAQQAVVLAALAALNRILEGLPTKEAVP